MFFFFLGEDHKGVICVIVSNRNVTTLSYLNAVALSFIILYRVVAGDAFVLAHCACTRVLVPGSTARMHGRRGDSLSNCFLNVTAASLDFSRTGQETFRLLVFAQPVSFPCYLKTAPPHCDFRFSSIVCPPQLFVHACMRIQRLPPIYIIQIKENLNYGDHSGVHTRPCSQHHLNLPI